MKRSAMSVVAVVGSVVGLLTVLLAGCTGNSQSRIDAATGQARTFLQDWSDRKYADAAALTDHPAAAQATMRRIQSSLNAQKVDFAAAKASVHGDRATVAVTAHWTIPGLVPTWDYSNRLTLQKVGGHWRVRWSPAVVHPQLKDAETIEVTRRLPERAALQDNAGTSLFTATPVVDVGVEPKLVTDLAALAQSLHEALGTYGITSKDVTSAVTGAAPTDFVPIITLRRSDYESVRSRIHDLPGTVFHTGTRLLAPSSSFAPLLLGRVSPATAQVLHDLGEGYLPTDQVGTSGLQAAFNKVLTGQAGATVDLMRGSEKVAQIGSIAPKPGTPVRTTIDRNVQDAADNALAHVSKPASIVAIRPSTGAILAVANSPSTPYDIALQGQYPAGSTFKIITASALLQRHVVKANEQVPCPGTTTVYGKVFHNENSFDLGTVPVRSAFAHSCNTTFTRLSTRLGPHDLATTAAKFGIGAGWSLPVPTFSGKIPEPKDDAEKAADAIGQGRVLVSPLAMALVAATVQHGSTPSPSIVQGQPATARKDTAAPDTTVLQTVKTYMRAVVTEGTATRLADVSGGPVYGKTGTAEYGNAHPPHSHAWFAGFQGDLAFAVFVQGGESSSTTAVPIADDFLTGLNG